MRQRKAMRVWEDVDDCLDKRRMHSQFGRRAGRHTWSTKAQVTWSHSDSFLTEPGMLHDSLTWFLESHSKEMK